MFNEDENKSKLIEMLDMLSFRIVQDNEELYVQLVCIYMQIFSLYIRVEPLL